MKIKSSILSIIALFTIHSCYVYKPYEEKTEELAKSQKIKETVSKNNPEQSIETNIKKIIVAKAFYKIEANNNFYKIEAGKWKGDTLYANIKGHPNKQLKFHKDEIKDVKVRQFSKGRSDVLTIGAYIISILGIVLLLK